jgi:hypothetical protein
MIHYSKLNHDHFGSPGMSDQQQKLASLRDLQRSLRQLESDYDKSQGSLRQSAATWIVAGFGAIGVALGLTPISSPFGTIEPLVAVAVISLAADLGLRNLWILDQLVYQQLLHTAFALGLRIEQDLPRNERYRTALYALVHNAADRLSAYYRVPIQVFLGLAAASIALHAATLAMTVCFSCSIDWRSILILGALLIFFGIALVRYIDVLDEVRHDDIADKLREINREFEPSQGEASQSAPYVVVYERLASRTAPQAYRSWSRRVWEESGTGKIIRIPIFFFRVIVCSLAWLLREMGTTVGILKEK